MSRQAKPVCQAAQNLRLALLFLKALACVQTKYAARRAFPVRLAMLGFEQPEFLGKIQTGKPVCIFLPVGQGIRVSGRILYKVILYCRIRRHLCKILKKLPRR